LHGKHTLNAPLVHDPVHDADALLVTVSNADRDLDHWLPYSIRCI
jgi:hypothetical protein